MSNVLPYKPKGDTTAKLAALDEFTGEALDALDAAIHEQRVAERETARLRERVLFLVGMLEETAEQVTYAETRGALKHLASELRKEAGR